MGLAGIVFSVLVGAATLCAAIGDARAAIIGIVPAICGLAGNACAGASHSPDVDGIWRISDTVRNRWSVQDDRSGMKPGSADVQPGHDGRSDGFSQGAPDPGSTTEREAYHLAREIGTVAAWNAFLKRFPSGLWADLARAARDKLIDGQGARDAERRRALESDRFWWNHQKRESASTPYV